MGKYLSWSPGANRLRKVAANYLWRQFHYRGKGTFYQWILKSLKCQHSTQFAGKSFTVQAMRPCKKLERITICHCKYFRFYFEWDIEVCIYVVYFLYICICVGLCICICNTTCVIRMRVYLCMNLIDILNILICYLCDNYPNNLNTWCPYYGRL